ncbi:MAG TPA: YfhO family protein [Candidatus Xenobia bacterium]|jgi:hypothetical protein
MRRPGVLFAVGLAVLLALAYSPLVFGGRFLYYGDIRDNHVWRQTLGWMGEHHRLIWWSPWEFSGMSTLGDIQKGMLYPLSWPFYCLALGPAYSTYSLLHAWLIGLGLYCLARALGLPSLPAAVAGASFSLGSFMVCHLDETPVVGVVTWLPWLLLCVLRFLQSANPRWFAAAALLVALQSCAGSPQFVYFSGLLTVVMTVLWTAVHRNWRRAVLVVLVFAGGALLAAPQLFPATYAARQCPRHGGMSYAFCSSYNLTPRMLWTLVSPFSQGGPDTIRADEEDGPGYRALEAVTNTRQDPYHGDWSLGEMCLYPGLAVLVLSVVGLASRRRLAGVLAGGIVLAVWIALGYVGGLHRLLYQVLPGFSYFRAPSRFGLFADLGFSLLAGLGLQTLLEGRGRGLAVVASVGAWGLLWMAPGRDVAGPLAAMAGVALLMVGLSVFPRSAGVFLVLAGASLDLLINCQGYTRTSPPSSLTPDIPVLAAAHKVPGLFRLVFGTSPRIRGSMVSDLLTYRLQSIQGANPMVPLRYVQFLFFNEGGRFPEAGRETEENLSVRNYLFIMTHVPSRLLELANARAWLSAPEGQPIQVNTDPRSLDRFWFAPRFEVDDGEHALARVQSGEVDPRATVLLASPPGVTGGSAPGHVADVRYDFDHTDLRVEAAGAGFVCTSEVYDPGWRATVDGRDVPVLRAFHTFMAIPIGAGTHQVSWRYWPVGLTAGMLCSGLTALALALACWRWR